MTEIREENSIASIASKFINNTYKNVFLTGKAGTGKTTFLKHLIKHTYKNAVIVAPTGIAAINAGGVTIHSLFQLPFGAFIPVRDAQIEFNENIKINTPNTIFKGFQINASKRKLLQELELLIIDEVSMLRADLLDAIDTVLKSVRKKNHLPFGGVQLLFIGDLLQLPPVVKDEEWRYLKNYYKSAFFFDAQALIHNKPLYIELDKIYRQSDNSFISILNNLRCNQVTKQDIETLNSHYKPDFKADIKENYIHLTTHNNKADALNRESLSGLTGRSYFYKAETTGDFNEYSYPVELNLELKKSAQIMFIKNDPTGSQRFFNGKIGIVSNINDNLIEVSFADGSKAVSIEKYEWQNIKYTFNETTNEIEEKINGTFTQYPIKLAWAITVHKSQGLTFTKAIIDIGQAFAPGQVYVALSRLTNLDGLILSSPINTNSLNVDNGITEYSNTKESAEALSDLFESESFIFFQNYVVQCFNMAPLSHLLTAHIESYQKDEQKSTKQKYFEWAFEIKKEVDATKLVADKFLNQLQQIFNSKQIDYKEQLKTRIEAAKNHFTPILKQFSKTILKQIEHLQSEKKVKAYLVELSELDALFFKQLQLIKKAEAMVKTATENSEFSKEKINTIEENKERINELSTIKPEKEKKRVRKTEKEKLEKTNTKEVTFNLYKQGKSIEEIASERKMVAMTIEGHLAYYAGLGMIDVKLFVNEEKMKNIITVSKKLDTTLFGAIKQSLGDEYTYSEIRFAMAYDQNSKK
ncbi:MAG: helix-turn-helix domain-containing protein [Bacteroidetes bacterium]|nr:helix-turn-helix domain-containing protein [Bacteroidota bacterium]